MVDIPPDELIERLKDGKVYSSEIIRSLRKAELIVVEGTLYPLLNRLAKDNLLAYEWQESEQGPPRPGAAQGFHCLRAR